jgi:hypothetical protein
MPGVRAAATRHASGGYGAGLGFAVREAGARGKRRARGLAGDTSERGPERRQKGKREGAAVGAPCRGPGRAAGGVSGAGLLREEERGKLTGGARSSAAPGEGEGARGGAAVGGLGCAFRVVQGRKGKRLGRGGAGLRGLGWFGLRTWAVLGRARGRRGVVVLAGLWAVWAG